MIRLALSEFPDYASPVSPPLLPHNINFDDFVIRSIFTNAAVVGASVSYRSRLLH